MIDTPTMTIGIGDEVRVHYYPPGPTTSFVEGVVSRVEVPTLRGRVFVLDVTYEVILDREQPIKSGYQNYVLYERWEEFPGRIEVLAGGQREPASDPEQVSGPEAEQGPEPEREVVAQAEPKPAAERAPLQENTSVPEPELKPSRAVEPEPLLKAEAQSEPFHVDGQDTPKRTRLISALFRKQR